MDEELSTTPKTAAPALSPLLGGPKAIDTEIENNSNNHHSYSQFKPVNLQPFRASPTSNVPQQPPQNMSQTLSSSTDTEKDEIVVVADLSLNPKSTVPTPDTESDSNSGSGEGGHIDTINSDKHNIDISHSKTTSDTTKNSGNNGAEMSRDEESAHGTVAAPRIQEPPTRTSPYDTRSNGNHSNGQPGSNNRNGSDGGSGTTQRISNDQGYPVSPSSHHPKRKRSAHYADLDEDKIDAAILESAAANQPDQEQQSRPSKTARRGKILPPSKGIILGYWRDSTVPDIEGRHAVIGFIDSRDRLRTRIQPFTRWREEVSSQYPIPPGPGGSWVTFERIVFSDFLVGLDQSQVKEFVKVRSLDRPVVDQSDEEKLLDDRAAIAEALRRLELNPVPDSILALAPIAYGVDIPERPPPGQKADLKRRATFGSSNNNANNNHNRPNSNNPAPLYHTPPSTLSPSFFDSQQQASMYQPPLPGGLDPLHGTRPTRILLGCWKKSDAENPQDRHAVYGILGINDMFRVKVVRETRDGRFAGGNFPQGAGALWIVYEDLQFESHLESLSRREVKEYCRVRQRQIDLGEKPEDRIDNETKAVYEAQARAARLSKHGYHQHVFPPAFQAIPPSPEDPPPFAGGRQFEEQHHDSSMQSGGHVSQTGGEDMRLSLSTSANQQRPSQADEPRQSRVSSSMVGSGNARELDRNALERSSRIAHREISRLENSQARSMPRRDSATATADSIHAAPAPISAGAIAGLSFSSSHSSRLNRNERLSNSPNGGGGVGGPALHTHGLGVDDVDYEQHEFTSPTLVQSSVSTVPRMRLGDSDDMQRLNKVWARQQEAHQIQDRIIQEQKQQQQQLQQQQREQSEHLSLAMRNDSKNSSSGQSASMSHNGVRYDRKTTGPFAGKLVSKGSILTIDGEDYVEYRVLLKPSF